MTNTEGPIAFRLHGGQPCVIGPEARIAPALHGAQPVTIEAGKLAGDIVALTTAYAPEPGSGVGWAQRAVLARIEHPTFGVLLVAPIDTRYAALDQAPALRAIIAAGDAGTRESDRRIAADDARIAALDEG